MSNLFERANKYRAHKSLGQNFLISEHALETIANALDKRTKHVIEIGPGLGFLTEQLLARDFQVYAVDLDKDALERVTEHKNLKKFHQDILDFDFSQIPQPFSIAGNLPFHVASKILIKIIGEMHEPKWREETVSQMVLMFQLEVAQRLTANTGEPLYNQLSVLMKAKTQNKFILKVPAQDFLPKPKIDAGVITIIPQINKSFEILNEEQRQKLYKIVRTAFQMRRKTLRNSLKELIKTETFEKANLDSGLRPERVNLEQFISLVQNCKSF